MTHLLPNHLGFTNSSILLSNPPLLFQDYMYTPLFFIVLVLYYKISFPICGGSFIGSTQPSLAWLPLMFPPRNLLLEAEVRECWVQGQQPAEGHGLSISHSLEPVVFDPVFHNPSTASIRVSCFCFP